jgi:hypothetical protein
LPKFYIFGTVKEVVGTSEITKYTSWNVGNVANVLEVHTASIFKVIPKATWPTSTKHKGTATNSRSIMNHHEIVKSIIQ